MRLYIRASIFDFPLSHGAFSCLFAMVFIIAMCSLIAYMCKPLVYFQDQKAACAMNRMIAVTQSCVEWGGKTLLHV